MTQEVLLETARYIVEFCYGQRNFEKSVLYSPKLPVIGNKFFQNNGQRNCRVYHDRYNIIAQNGQIAVVVGTFRLSFPCRTGTAQKKVCVVSMTLNCRENGVEAVMIHISEKFSHRKYHLKDVRERCHMIDEMDVFYLEAAHNHTKWHCRDQIIDTTGTLKRTEDGLSDAFMRIHRGFIVNRFHVRRIERCYVELDNGDRLQVPVKRYMTVKGQLSKMAEIGD